MSVKKTPSSKKGIKLSLTPASEARDNERRRILSRHQEVETNGVTVRRPINPVTGGSSSQNPSLALRPRRKGAVVGIEPKGNNMPKANTVLTPQKITFQGPFAPVEVPIYVARNESFVFLNIDAFEDEILQTSVITTSDSFAHIYFPKKEMNFMIPLQNYSCYRYLGEEDPDAKQRMMDQLQICGCKVEDIENGMNVYHSENMALLTVKTDGTISISLPGGRPFEVEENMDPDTPTRKFKIPYISVSWLLA